MRKIMEFSQEKIGLKYSQNGEAKAATYQPWIVARAVELLDCNQCD